MYTNKQKTNMKKKKEMFMMFLPACSTNGNKHSKLDAIPNTLVTAAFPTTQTNRVSYKSYIISFLVTKLNLKLYGI
jgi:hypothetical protein